MHDAEGVWSRALAGPGEVHSLLDEQNIASEVVVKQNNELELRGSASPLEVRNRWSCFAAGGTWNNRESC
jgi:hypothetical protein